jgi:protein-L-isoaspartate(D-aspartate) O-methyltransferase
VAENEEKPGDSPFLADADSPYWAKVRAIMVETQMRARGIESSRVLEAMRHVPRHVFVPPNLRASAYDDRPLDIGHGQTISQPYMVAHMTEELRLSPTDKVLEIGAGSGYQAAVLSMLARQVVTVERFEPLAKAAAARLRSLGVTNVSVEVGDGTLGWPSRAPYDAILVAAAAPHLPAALMEQLAIGGRLVCPVGGREGQILTRITRREESYHAEEGIMCMFVPLIGEQGWPQQ